MAGFLSVLCALVAESFQPSPLCSVCPGKPTHTDHITGSHALCLPFQFGHCGSQQ